MNHIRHLALFDPRNHQNITTTIIGCGSIGSWLAPSLVRMGLKSFILYDGDTVSPHNIPLQYFCARDKNRKKADITAKNMQSLEPGINVKSIPRYLTRKDTVKTDICILATDSIASRKLAYNRIDKRKCKLLIDGRMGGETFTIYTIRLTNKRDVRHYEKSLKQAETEQTCTARGIVYTSNIIAGFMCNQLKRYLNIQPYHKEINYDVSNYGILSE